ncbi:unnamed protein product [Clonostachys rhizophaga]|uniref:Uncharacterized protein n=1 Tax=Clonostachys rhizophaga TaxID=160324 RepID=A0A9N9YTT4_9HYPO|nr:unnamed protein product [Clonostachys rhizophaga]
MSKQTILITGCSDGGIGSALAIVFQKRGFHVFASARDPTKMSTLKDLPNITLLTLDVHVVDTISEKTNGTLDFLISNAGRNHFMPILDEDLDTVRNLFEINFFAPIALAQAFAPLLIKAKGMAVFIASTAGYLNIPYMGTYSASKRGMEVVADTLRFELAPFGVDVLEVVTGGVKSRGQTYFGDFKLSSLYKKIESTVANRAQGGDGMPRMDTEEYAAAVSDAILKRTTGRFWCGQHADQVRMGTTAVEVPQEAMDAGAVIGTGLEELP